YDLATIAACAVCAENSVADLQAVDVPAKPVFVRRVVIGLWIERGIRSGGLSHPVLTNDMGTMPYAAGKIKLSELELVAGPEIEPAAHIGFARRHEIHMVGA